MSERETDDVELDGHALAMIAAYRQEEALLPDVHERVWDRVEGEVGASAVPASAAKWGVVLVAAAAAIAVAVLGARTLVSSDEKADAPQQAPYGYPGDPDGGALGVAEDAPPMHVERGATPRVDEHDVEEGRGVEAEHGVAWDGVGAVEVAKGASPPAAIETASGSEPEPAAKPRARRAPRDEARTPAESVPEPEPEPADTLAEETRLLGRARVALAESRPKAALSILDEHARRFSAGRLAPERAALRVIALCDAGRHDEGSKAAAAFLATHSGHALASRVRRACER